MSTRGKLEKFLIPETIFGIGSLAEVGASLRAGIAFTNALLGATHAITHQIGGYLELHDAYITTNPRAVSSADAEKICLAAL